MHFEYWYEAFIFIMLFTGIIWGPCLIVAIIGSKMVNKLGHYPSKTPAIQLSIFGALIVTELLSFGAVMAFYKFFSTSSK